MTWWSDGNWVPCSVLGLGVRWAAAVWWFIKERLIEPDARCRCHVRDDVFPHVLTLYNVKWLKRLYIFGHSGVRVLISRIVTQQCCLASQVHTHTHAERDPSPSTALGLWLAGPNTKYYPVCELSVFVFSPELRECYNGRDTLVF